MLLVSIYTFQTSKNSKMFSTLWHWQVTMKVEVNSGHAKIYATSYPNFTCCNDKKCIDSNTCYILEKKIKKHSQYYDLRSVGHNILVTFAIFVKIINISVNLYCIVEVEIYKKTSQHCKRYTWPRKKRSRAWPWFWRSRIQARDSVKIQSHVSPPSIL